MRAGDEPEDASRNDWFTGSSLDCAAGYRALEKGRIPRSELARGAPWHLDISASIHRNVPIQAKQTPGGERGARTGMDEA